MLFLKSEFMLSDTFEATGEWWLPQKPEKKVFGTLRRSATVIDLELSGSLESVSANDIAIGATKFPDHPCIHGVSNEGKEFTLFKAGCVGRGTTTKYSAIYMIVNKLTTDLANLNFKAAHVYCNHLDAFIAVGGLFDEKLEEADGEFKSSTVKFIQPKKAAFHIKPLATALELDVEGKASWKRMSVKLSARTFAHFIPDKPQDTDWFMTKIWRFCYLLTLLTDERVSPTGIRVEIEGQDGAYWLLYRAGKEDLDDAERVTPVFLFHLGHVFKDFEAILTKWFTAEEMMLDAIHLMMDAHRNPDQSMHGRFLLMAHAVEVISRATTSSEYMTEPDYKKIIITMNSAIPKHVAKDLKDSLKSKIKYGNEYAFHKRIKVLLASLSDKAREIVCKDVGQFSRGIADTRNYYTHFTDELRPKALKGAAEYWATEKLMLLVRITLFKYIGVPEEVIIKHLSEHHRLLQRIFHAKGQPECIKIKGLRKKKEN